MAQDREARTKTLSVDTAECSFKLALAKKQYGDVMRMIRSSRLCGQVLHCSMYAWTAAWHVLHCGMAAPTTNKNSTSTTNDNDNNDDDNEQEAEQRCDMIQHI